MLVAGDGGGARRRPNVNRNEHAARRPSPAPKPNVNRREHEARRGLTPAPKPAPSRLPPPPKAPVFRVPTPGPVRETRLVQPPIPKAPAWKAPKVKAYPTTPAPLSAEDLAYLNDMTTGAKTAYETALAEEVSGRNQAGVAYRESLAESLYDFKRGRNSEAAELSNSGLSRSPAFMGQVDLDLRHEQGLRDRSYLYEKAAREKALADIVARAKQRMNAVNGEAARYKATKGADIAQLIRGVMGG